MTPKALTTEIMNVHTLMFKGKGGYRTEKISFNRYNYTSVKENTHLDRLLKEDDKNAMSRTMTQTFSHLGSTIINNKPDQINPFHIFISQQKIIFKSKHKILIKNEENLGDKRERLSPHFRRKKFT